MSKTTDTTIWGIHAGKTGDADSLFIKQDCIAVGWAKMGDLSVLKPWGKAEPLDSDFARG